MPTDWETNNDHSGCISLVYFCLPAGYFRQFLGNHAANQRRQRRIPSAADSLSSFLFPQPPCPPINLSLVFPVTLFPTSPLSSGFSLCFTKNLLFPVHHSLMNQSLGQNTNTIDLDFGYKATPESLHNRIDAIFEITALRIWRQDEECFSTWSVTYNCNPQGKSSDSHQSLLVACNIYDY